MKTALILLGFFALLLLVPGIRFRILRLIVIAVTHTLGHLYEHHEDGFLIVATVVSWIIFLIILAIVSTPLVLALHYFS